MSREKKRTIALTVLVLSVAGLCSLLITVFWFPRVIKSLEDRDVELGWAMQAAVGFMNTMQTNNGLLPIPGFFVFAPICLLLIIGSAIYLKSSR